MIKMRCLRPVHTFEGDLVPGDVFSVGYKHERNHGILHATTKIAWIIPSTRAKELVNTRIAQYYDLPVEHADVEISPVQVKFYGDSVSESKDEVVVVPIQIKVEDDFIFIHKPMETNPPKAPTPARRDRKK